MTDNADSVALVAAKTAVSNIQNVDGIESVVVILVDRDGMIGMSFSNDLCGHTANQILVQSEQIARHVYPECLNPLLPISLTVH